MRLMKGKNRFHDRSAAGKVLAAELTEYTDRSDVLVLALPRGGVPVAYEVAIALKAPLDVFMVRKLGVPGHKELAMGAIASGGVRVLDDALLKGLGISDEAVASVSDRERQELERREELYRQGRSLPDIGGKTAILVDDGLATGSTMRAAIKALKKHNPAEIVVAVPTAAAATCKSIEEEVDRTFFVMTPDPFYAVGVWYDRFTPTSDDEVTDLLERAELGESIDGTGLD